MIKGHGQTACDASYYNISGCRPKCKRKLHEERYNERFKYTRTLDSGWVDLDKKLLTLKVLVATIDAQWEGMGM